MSSSVSAGYTLLAAVAAEDDLSNGQVLSWDLATGIALPQHVWREAAILDATLIPSRTNPLLPAYFASTAIRTSALHIHSLQKERPVARWYGHEKVCVLAASPDGRWLVGGNEVGGLMLWELETGRLYAHLLDAHLRRVNKVLFSNDGAAIVSASEDGFCKVWSVESLIIGITSAKPLHSFSDHSKGLTGLHLGYGRSFRSSRLLTCSSDGSCILYDLVDGACLAKYNFPSPLTGCLMNATETLILASAVDGNVYLVDLGADSYDLAHDSSILISAEGGRKQPMLATMNGSPITRMAFTLDEATLVTGDASGILTVWNVTSRMIIRQINAVSMVPGGSIRWLSIVPKAALSRAEPVRTFGQLRRAVDSSDKVIVESLLSRRSLDNLGKEGGEKSVGKTDDGALQEELERLREENGKLKEAHQKLIESIEASL